MRNMKIGLIGGSGLGAALASQTGGTRHEIDTPFGRPSDAVIETQWAGLSVLFLSRHGPGHTINPSQIPNRANIHALKQLGCTHIIASGAVGSLREEFHPRDLVIPDQVIDKTHRRVGTFFDKAAVHVEMAEPFCPVLRQILLEAGKQVAAEHHTAPAGSATAAGERDPSPPAFSVHGHGCYVCMEGPAFSTRAESLMHRLWGGDLIGMTAMPEAKLAREAEISYALVALVTDYDCWRATPASAQAGADASTLATSKAQLLQEIIANLQAATDNAVRLIQKAVVLLSEQRETLAASPAHSALELAIWSNKASIPADEVERLGPIWGRYFQ